MNPSRPFILRPVATALLMAAILLVGIVAYLQLPMSALPQVDYPTIQVVTFYPGASPDVTATTITAPLERQFGEMQGLSQMTSTSAGGVSVIVLQFDLSLELDVAEQEVQASINSAGSDPDAGDFLRYHAAFAGGRHGGHSPGAAPLAAERRWISQHQRRAEACGARAGKSHQAFSAWLEHGGRAHSADASQRQCREGEL